MRTATLYHTWQATLHFTGMVSHVLPMYVAMYALCAHRFVFCCVFSARAQTFASSVFSSPAFDLFVTKLAQHTGGLPKPL